MSPICVAWLCPVVAAAIQRASIVNLLTIFSNNSLDDVPQSGVPFSPKIVCIKGYIFTHIHTRVAKPPEGFAHLNVFIRRWRQIHTSLLCVVFRIRRSIVLCACINRHRYTHAHTQTHERISIESDLQRTKNHNSIQQTNIVEELEDMPAFKRRIRAIARSNSDAS